MHACKLINDDVRRAESKAKREAHKEQFRRAREVEVALVADWGDQEAKKELNRAQQIPEEQRQANLDDMANRSVSF